MFSSLTRNNLAVGQLAVTVSVYWNVSRETRQEAGLVIRQPAGHDLLQLVVSGTNIHRMRIIN